MDKIKWYLEYAWIKLNIWVLTPLVWIENKWNKYKETRLAAYVRYQIVIDELNKKRNNLNNV